MLTSDEKQKIVRRNAMASAASVLLYAARPEDRHHALKVYHSAVNVNEWISGLFVDFTGFTKAQEKRFLTEFTRLVPKAGVQMQRRTRDYPRGVSLSIPV